MTRRTSGGWVVGLGLLAATALVAGCGEQKGDAGKPKYRIALIMKSLANEFFTTMADGARKHHEKNASEYDLIVNGMKNETDVNEQIGLVEQMIADKVDAIILAPADSKLLVGVCKKARQRGIVVVNIDNPLDADTVKEAGVSIPFVGPDNREGARLAGEYLAKKLQKGDQVAIIEGRPNALNGEMRKLGFTEAMDKAGIEVARSQTANWERDEAEKVVAGIVAGKPELKAFLCANDSMALGAVAALRRLPNVLIVGYDNIAAIQENIKTGRVLCTVDQHADRIAVEGIHVALNLLEKREIRDYTRTAVDVVTKDTLK